MAICAYPQLIAAYHVFHRLLMPRHSPCALSNLTSLFQVLFSLELLQNYMSKCYLLFEIVVIHFHALPVLYVDNFLLDFLHYSVDNLHLRHKVSKVIAYQIFVLIFTAFAVPTIGLLYQLFTNTVLLRKEVIQPHLPIRLPCYDFTPIIDPTFDCVLLAVRLQASGVANSHGVTGGVYKARERIHRSMLICDY